MHRMMAGSATPHSLFAETRVVDGFSADFVHNPGLGGLAALYPQRPSSSISCT